jgi:O-antigen/teichoic acid export membrane protein
MAVRISKRFIKSSLIYTLAGTLPMASAIILLPFYIHFLPRGEFGKLSIYLAFSMLVQIVVTYSFDTSIYVYFHDYKNERRKLAEFVSSAFVFVILLGTVVTLVTAFLGSILFDRLFAEQKLTFYPYGLLSAGAAIFQAIFKIYSSLLQSRERPATYLWSNVLSFSVTAGLTVAGLYFYPATLIGPIGGRVVAAMLSAVWALVMIFREFGFHFNYTLLRASFPFNRSSYLYQLQLWSMNYLDRMLLLFFVTTDVIGVYDFAMKCMLVIDFIVGGLYNSFYPKVLGMIMVQDKKQTTVEINRYYHGLTGVVMLLVCLSVPGFMVLIDSGIIKSGYEDAIHYMPLIGVTYLVRSIRYYFTLPYGALKYSKPLPWIYLGISAFKIGLMLLFVGRYGVYAVIGSAVLSTALEIILLRRGVADRFHFQMNALKLISAPILLALVMTVTFLIAGETSYGVQALYLAVCVGLLATFYRRELRQLKLSKNIESRKEA